MYLSEKGIPIYINEKVEEIEDMFVYLHFWEGKDTNQWKITLGDENDMHQYVWATSSQLGLQIFYIYKEIF